MDEAGQHGIYPQAVLLIVLSFIVVLLNVGPFVWYLKGRNYPAAILIFWVVLLNVFSFVNAIIWRNDDIDSWFSGHIYCDVESRLLLGSYSGAPGALICVMRSLAMIFDTNNATLVPSEGQRKKDLIFMLVFCWAFPIYIMAVYYIVQPARYLLFGIVGCVPLADESWLSDILILIWPLVLTLISVYYAVLLLIRMQRYRSEFTSLLSLSNTTKARFLRLLFMGIVLILILLPFQIYVFYLSHSGIYHPYSWSEVHSGDWWYVWEIPSDGFVLIDRWIYVVVAFLSFCCFGTGPDAVIMYRSWLVNLGLVNQHSNATTRSWFRTSPWNVISDRAKFLFSKVSTTSTTSATESHGRSSINSDSTGQLPFPCNLSQNSTTRTSYPSHRFSAQSLSQDSTTADIGLHEILMMKEISTEKDMPHGIV